MRDMLKSKN